MFHEKLDFVFLQRTESADEWVMVNWRGDYETR
jgi:hypothetical protein